MRHKAPGLNFWLKMNSNLNFDWTYVIKKTRQNKKIILIATKTFFRQIIGILSLGRRKRRRRFWRVNFHDQKSSPRTWNRRGVDPPLLLLDFSKATGCAWRQVAGGHKLAGSPWPCWLELAEESSVQRGSVGGSLVTQWGRGSGRRGSTLSNLSRGGSPTHF